LVIVTPTVDNDTIGTDIGNLVFPPSSILVCQIRQLCIILFCAIISNAAKGQIRKFHMPFVIEIMYRIVPFYVTAWESGRRTIIGTASRSRSEFRQIVTWPGDGQKTAPMGVSGNWASV